MDFGYMNQNIDLRDKVKKFIKENLTEAVKDELEASERTENIPPKAWPPPIDISLIPLIDPKEFLP